MIKKLVTFSLFIFSSVLFGILIAGFLVSQQKCNTTQSGKPSGQAAATASSTLFSLDEVAKHKTAADCWQVIDGKVYAFSSYLNQHPGGADIIIAYCGQDASQAFATKGGEGRDHSSFARKLLTNYLVGDLNQKAGGANPSQARPQTTTSQSSSSAPANGSVALTADEVAKHSSAGSCWLIISSKVYDVSGYLSKHPAGSGAITPYCGQDATAAFSGSSGGHVHSGFAWNLLGGFYLGDMGQQATSAALQQAQTAAQQAPAGQGNDD